MPLLLFWSLLATCSASVVCKSLRDLFLIRGLIAVWRHKEGKALPLRKPVLESSIRSVRTCHALAEIQCFAHRATRRAVVEIASIDKLVMPTLFVIPSQVPQVRARFLGANLGSTVPRGKTSIESFYGPRSATVPAIRAVPLPHLQLLPPTSQF